jgi:hypothetical protein
MNVAREGLTLSSLLVGAALSVFGNTAIAQATSPAAGQVPGAKLQTWLDQKFSYAGVHESSGCYFMNSADAKGRVLFLSCPNDWSAKLQGTARVAGDTLCTNFPAPAGEECLTWHAVGDSKFEQRSGSLKSTSLHVLPAAPGR